MLLKVLWFLVCSSLIADGAFLLPPVKRASSVATNYSEVTIKWDKSPSDGVVSYNLYYGFTNRNYVKSVNTTNLQVTLDKVIVGQTYYFAATALDSYGLESDYSDELIYNIPVRRTVVTIRSEGWLDSSIDTKNWTPDVNHSITNPVGIKFFRGVNVTIKQFTIP